MILQNLNTTSTTYPQSVNLEKYSIVLSPATNSQILDLSQKKKTYLQKDGKPRMLEMENISDIQSMKKNQLLFMLYKLKELMVITLNHIILSIHWTELTLFEFQNLMIQR